MANLIIQTPRPTLNALPFTWITSTCPEVPVSLPKEVQIEIAPDAVQVFAFRKTEGWPEDQKEVIPVTFSKVEIVGVEIILRPDGLSSARKQAKQYASLMTIRRHDPYEVVPYFEETFSSLKQYWLKAFAKMLRERAGIEPTISEDDPYGLIF